MDIEKLAISRIDGLLARCPHLQSLIDSNDKTPFTDGHVHVYSIPQQTRSNWRGRVAVQVKGRSFPGERRKSPPSHSVSRADLLAFQRDGGVLYFYVSIGPGGTQRDPYYAVLTPFRIEHYLRQMQDEQQTIAIRFKKFPDQPAAIEGVVELALKAQKQNLELGAWAVGLAKPQAFNIFSTEDLDFKKPLRLDPDETDLALEMTTSDGVSVPLDGTLEILPADYMERTSTVSISAGSTTYDHVTVRRVDTGTVEVGLDVGLSMSLRDTSAKRQCGLNVTAQSNFAKRKRALEFVIAFADSGRIEIDRHPIPLEEMARDDSATLREMRDQLGNLRDLQDLFDVLDVDGRYVELGELTDEHWRGLKHLHHILVKGAAPVNPTGGNARVLAELGRWAVVLIVVREKGGAWRCVDPFAAEGPRFYYYATDEDSLGETLPVTPYETLDREYFPRVLNLHLESIVDAYEAISDFEHTSSLANQCVLKLITSADSCERRKDEFLRAAGRLNDWIISKEGEGPIHRINKFQIRWRLGTLTDDDRNVIRGIRRDAARTLPAMTLEIELSSALLLGDAEEVAYLGGQLTDEQRRTMMGWPIWHLHQRGVADGCEEAGAEHPAGPSAGPDSRQDRR